MGYRLSDKSGLKLPAISLGCWDNFGDAGTDSQHLTSEAGYRMWPGPYSEMG